MEQFQDIKLHAKDRFVKLPEVLFRTGISRTTLYDEMSKGRFPRNYTLLNRGVAWREKDIDAWIAEKIEKGGSP